MLDRFEDRGYAIHSFRSADKLREGADFDKDVATLSVLNSIMDGSAPNHELRVCVGCVCLLLKSIAPEEGFAKNNRVIVTSIESDYICVQSISTGCILGVYRMFFEILVPKSGMRVCRRQYPLKLAYGITFMKSAGQTLDRVTMDATEAVFTLILEQFCVQKNVRCPIIFHSQEFSANW